MARRGNLNVLYGIQILSRFPDETSNETIRPLTRVTCIGNAGYIQKKFRRSSHFRSKNLVDRYRAAHVVWTITHAAILKWTSRPSRKERTNFVARKHVCWKTFRIKRCLPGGRPYCHWLVLQRNRNDSKHVHNTPTPIVFGNSAVKPFLEPTTGLHRNVMGNGYISTKIMINGLRTGFNDYFSRNSVVLHGVHNNTTLNSVLPPLGIVLHEITT